VQETFYEAQKSNASEMELLSLRKFYYEMKDGIGVEKTPDNYGAFPTDPYSHTPSFSGVQQPGMTGQVKEDVISRFGELGVIVANGEICFNPGIVDINEFLTSKDSFEYYDVNENKLSIDLRLYSLAFTYCQVPVVFIKSSANKIVIYNNDNNTIEVNSLKLNQQISEDIFNRTGNITKIEVFLNL
jgi:hypothetical protein